MLPLKHLHCFQFPCWLVSSFTKESWHLWFWKNGNLKFLTFSWQVDKIADFKRCLPFSVDLSDVLVLSNKIQGLRVNLLYFRVIRFPERRMMLVSSTLRMIDVHSLPRHSVFLVVHSVRRFCAVVLKHGWSSSNFHTFLWTFHFSLQSPGGLVGVGLEALKKHWHRREPEWKNSQGG